MKKIFIGLIALVFLTGCASFPGQTKYQTKNLAKFERKKHRGPFIAKNRPSKRGSLNHPAVRKEDKRWQLQKIRYGNSE